MELDTVFCEKILALMGYTGATAKRNYNAVQVFINEKSKANPKKMDLIRTWLVKEETYVSIVKQYNYSPSNVRRLAKLFMREVKKPIYQVWFNEGIMDGETVHDQEFHAAAVVSGLDVTYQQYAGPIELKSDVRLLYLPSKIYNALIRDELYTIDDVIERIVKNARHWRIYNLSDIDKKMLEQALEDTGFLKVKKYVRREEKYERV